MVKHFHKGFADEQVKITQDEKDNMLERISFPIGRNKLYFYKSKRFF